MNLLKNFPIRSIMLRILALCCFMWPAVSTYSVSSPTAFGKGNDVNRAMVHQMTIMDNGYDQYFRL